MRSHLTTEQAIAHSPDVRLSKSSWNSAVEGIAIALSPESRRFAHSLEARLSLLELCCVRNSDRTLTIKQAIGVLCQYIGVLCQYGGVLC
ncbi:hypothetical protein [Nostoc sp. DedQUE09]|uniref:hypothetical protein n=1 Tax=Nostoc sp. DedQUE09 TaxID=3075394 RepID=UPI002AD21EEA|nr:hypothetical protein [Nostoc sp. DedQUE09]MDZ7955503.1 hypothetical protein [Nostoc sp. DedQUE09]